MLECSQYILFLKKRVYLYFLCLKTDIEHKDNASSSKTGQVHIHFIATKAINKKMFLVSIHYYCNTNNFNKHNYISLVTLKHFVGLSSLAFQIRPLVGFSSRYTLSYKYARMFPLSSRFLARKFREQTRR